MGWISNSRISSRVADRAIPGLRHTIETTRPGKECRIWATFEPLTYVLVWLAARLYILVCPPQFDIATANRDLPAHAIYFIDMGLLCETYSSHLSTQGFLHPS